MNYYNVKSDSFLSDLLFKFNKNKSIDVVTKFNSGSGHASQQSHGPRGPGCPRGGHGGPGHGPK